MHSKKDSLLLQTQTIVRHHQVAAREDVLGVAEFNKHQKPALAKYLHKRAALCLSVTNGPSLWKTIEVLGNSAHGWRQTSPEHLVRTRTFRALVAQRSSSRQKHREHLFRATHRSRKRD